MGLRVQLLGVREVGIEFVLEGGADSRLGEDVVCHDAEGVGGGVGARKEEQDSISSEFVRGRDVLRL